MLSSMTGFGAATVNVPLGRLIVEIQSVNRKYLEVAISLPKEFGRFEQEIRKWVSHVISRGSISVKMFLIPTPHAIEGLLPDVEILKGLKKGWERIAHALGTNSEQISLPFIMQYFPEQQKQEFASDQDLPALHRCISEALQALVTMKHTEGNTLAQDLATRLQELEQRMAEVVTQAPGGATKMRQRLFEKMEEVLKLGPEVEERLLREVALFAERVDISEEIIRFRSHIAQFKTILKGGVVGRKMDFLIQEMGREINTIGSKSVDAKISHLVVEMKSELEKIREQIQNIE